MGHKVQYLNNGNKSSHRNKKKYIFFLLNQKQMADEKKNINKNWKVCVCKLTKRQQKLKYRKK